MIFINSIDKKINNKFFTGQSWLSIFYKYWHSINLSYSRTYTRGVFRTQLNIYNKAFLWFSQRCSIVDVLLGSKYLYVHLHTVQSHRNYIAYNFKHIEYFAVKYLFLTKEEWNKMAVSELKLLSIHFKLA